MQLTVVTTPDHIGMIAACLTEHFLQPLYDFTNERNYFGYLGSLSEINDWAYEFFDEYYEAVIDWPRFQRRPANIYEASTLDVFLFAWGSNKMRHYFAENITHYNGSQEDVFKPSFISDGAK